MNLTPLLLCICCCFTTSAYFFTSPHVWTKLILTHHWPSTFCSMEHCHPNISYWTVHGLWKYEWNKHGTCAARAQSLNSQHKYFSKALELYHKLDLDGVLRKFNIVPSKEYYSFDDIEGAILKFYQVQPKIQCVQPGKGSQTQVLGQIEICFNPEFQLENCEKIEVDMAILGNSPKAAGFSVCDHTMPVYYPPLKRRTDV
ncbi:ribonuclease T2 isoform X5 [Hypomesus transpacificus]|uniref:ribonuclease T2 isoform X5 n=1 Tax=Hypomesus transpacificus TaxID=137520 RepID=UPI001F07638C|nr:ribonuclease T2 isoform X5 [Hypomesus transpacificus]